MTPGIDAHAVDGLVRCCGPSDCGTARAALWPIATPNRRSTLFPPVPPHRIAEITGESSAETNVTDLN